MTLQQAPKNLGILLAAWFCIAATTFAIAIPRIEEPGLYYDEAFLAQQARDFVEPDRAGSHPPSVVTTYLAGRPFPIRNATYLGSLKSQLLIPSLALFGSTPFVLRVTTLATALLGLLGCMLWARQLFDTKVAVAMALLAASDPAFHFFAQYEWGPFTTLLLCRGFGFALICAAFRSGAVKRERALYALAGLVLGLGVYSRADFALILFAAALGLAFCRRDLIGRAWQDQRSGIFVGAATFMIAASPLLAAIPQVLGAGAGISDRGDLAYRARVFWSTLDGSHFHRLMETGGLFDELFAVAVPSGILGYVWLAGMAGLIVIAQRNRTKDARAFVVVMTLVLGSCMIALPGAVRAHHMLNLFPLPHLIIATVGLDLCRIDLRSLALTRLLRSGVIAVGLLLLAGNGLAIHQTREEIRETGGRGRWTSALSDLVNELDARPDAELLVLVSVDWGFHEPLLFQSNRVQLAEPIWRAAATAASGRSLAMRGDEKSIYIFHPERYEVAPLSRAFRKALLGVDAEFYEVEDHRDRSGEVAFTTVRFLYEHRIGYDGTVLRIGFY